MKRTILLCLLLGFLSSEASIVYDFSMNNPKNASFTTKWTHNIKERKVIDGALHGVSTGNPAYFSPMEINRPLEEVVMAVVEMKADEGSGKVQIFLNLKDPSASYAAKELITDGKFHTYVFDLEKLPKVKNTGIVKSFRLEPTTGKGRHTFAIRSIRLIPRNRYVPEDSPDFDFDFSRPDPGNKYFVTCWASNIKERRITDGALHGVSTGNPAYFSTREVNIPLTRASIAIIEMKAGKGAGKVQVFINLKDQSASYAAKELITDGKFHTYTFDLEKLPKVKKAGIIKSFRLDPTTGKGTHAFAIRSIRLIPRHKLVMNLSSVVPKAPEKLMVPEFFQLPGGGSAITPTRLELSYTNEAFIIDFESGLNNVSYVANAQKDGPVYNDDCFDITFSFSRDSYYQLAFNPKGTTFDQKVTYLKYLPDELPKNTNLGHAEISWNANAAIKTNIVPGKWSGQALVPWKSFGLDAPPKSFKFNIARCSKADGKGMSGISYSPILSFAAPDNLRTIRLGRTPSAVVTVDRKVPVLPGKNTIAFKNPNGRELECTVTARDLMTGKEHVFKTKAKSEKIFLVCELKESEYELILTAGENGLTTFFDAFGADTSALRRKFANASKVVRNWSSTGAFASRKASLEKRAAAISAQNPPDYAAIKNYIDEVERVNRDLRLENLLQETGKYFGRADIPFAIAEASPADKIFHSLDADVPAFAGRPAAGLKIEGAKNETEGIQLVLLGVKKPVTGLKLRLVSAPSGKVPAITFHGVDFLDTSKAPDTRYTSPYKGEWPEVLSNDLPASLAPGEVRSIWVNAEIAADVPAGIYTWQLEISADGVSPVRIPLSVRVWNFSLPAVPSLRAAMSTYEAFNLGYYSKFRKKPFTDEQKKAVSDTLARFMLKHRMNPGFIYTMSAFKGRLIEYPRLDRLAEYRKLGMNAIPVGQLPMHGYSSTADEMMAKYYTEDKLEKFMNTMKAVAELGTQLNLNDIFYVHAFDEIYAAAHKKEKMRKLRAIRERLRTAAPKVKVECISYADPELVGIVDIWCPSISMMARNAESFRERQKAGDELWLYTCLGSPGRESGQPPSFVLEESAAGLRLIGWICFFYKAEGFLYYAMNNWARNGARGGKPYPEEPWNIQYMNGYNGEACFIYPARCFDMEPLSSIRMENLRDGFEDYEYLSLLTKAFDAKKESLSKTECREIEDLLSMKKLVRSGFDYTDDSGKILGHRRQIAKWIERLNLNQGKKSVSAVSE